MNQPRYAISAPYLESNTSSLNGKLWGLGPPETTRGTPGTEERMHKWEGKYDFGEMFIICMFIPGQSMNMHIEYSI